jgi:Tfp pilus assembly protein PilN
MRPVNLIPPEDRRGDQAPLRTGPLAYVVLGALVAVLAGVTAMVLLDNQIGERETGLATVEREDAEETLKATRLSAYTEFRNLAEERVATVQSLADSRFDWERVMRELALILPSSVWLVDLTATASPGVSVGSGGDSGGGSSGGLRASAPGPAMELSGCATGQRQVAEFVTALKDIDGVTRVGVESSELPAKDSGAGVSSGGDAGSGNAGDDCRTRSFIAKFAIVVAFDAAPVPPTAAAEGEAPPTPAEQAVETKAEGDSASETAKVAAAEGKGG